MPKVDPEPNADDEHGTEGVPEDFFYTGLAATDGAASNSQFKPLRRCGWGAASCDEETGEMMWGRYGRLPFRLQRVLLAELWAVIQVIRFAVPPLKILADNATVVKGFRRGRRWCVHPSRPHAEIWRLAWKFFDEANEGEQKIEIQNTKAHIKKANLPQQGTEEHRNMVANMAADKLAVEGAQLHEIAAPWVDTFKNEWQLVQEIATYIARVAASSEVVDTQPPPTRVEKTEALKEKRAQRAEAERARQQAEIEQRQEAVRQGGRLHTTVSAETADAARGLVCRRVVCTLCRRTAVGVAAINAFRLEANCEGRFVDSLGGLCPSHIFRKSGRVIWCERCGRWATEKKHAGGLRRECGQPTVAGLKARDRLQRELHPRSGPVEF